MPRRPARSRHRAAPRRWHAPRSTASRYAPPESAENAPAFRPTELRALLDGHHLMERDWVFHVMEESQLFCPRQRGGGSRVFVAPDYNDGKEAQREATMR